MTERKVAPGGWQLVLKTRPAGDCRWFDSITFRHAWDELRPASIEVGPWRRSYTPEVMLSSMMESARAGRIDRLVVGVIWKDGEYTTGWSSGTAYSEACTIGAIIQREALRRMNEG